MKNSNQPPDPRWDVCFALPPEGRDETVTIDAPTPETAARLFVEGMDQDLDGALAARVTCVLIHVKRHGEPQPMITAVKIDCYVASCYEPVESWSVAPIAPGTYTSKMLAEAITALPLMALERIELLRKCVRGIDTLLLHYELRKDAPIAELYEALADWRTGEKATALALTEPYPEDRWVPFVCLKSELTKRAEDGDLVPVCYGLFIQQSKPEPAYNIVRFWAADPAEAMRHAAHYSNSKRTSPRSFHNCEIVPPALDN